MADLHQSKYVHLININVELCCGPNKCEARNENFPVGAIKEVFTLQSEQNVCKRKS